MKQQITMDLLKQSDEVTEEHIAEEFPYPVEKEESFERAYQNYLKMSSQMESHSPTPIITRKQLYRTCSLVACMLVTVGLSVGIWSKHQKIESRPPQETTTSTHSETTTETTAQVMTESQPTVAWTETSSGMPEFATSATKESDHIQPSESAAALLTTASEAETVAVITPQTHATEGATQPTTQQAEFTNTDLPQTTVTAPALEEGTSVTEQSTVSETTDDVQGSELQKWFAVNEQSDYVTITFQGGIQTSPEYFTPYLQQSERFDCEAIYDPTIAEDIPDPDTDVYVIYAYYTKDGEYVFSAIQSERHSFSIKCPQGAEVEYLEVNGAPGLLIDEGDSYSVYWDEDGYTFGIQNYNGDRSLLLEYARYLSPNVAE